VPAQGGQERQLTQHQWSPAGISSHWISTGSGLVVSGPEAPGAPIQFEHVSYPDGEIRRITNDLNKYLGVSLTADDSTLATIQANEIENLWVAGLSDAINAKPITTGGHARTPSWTPDNRIVYVLDEVNRKRLRIMSSDGSKSTPLPGTERAYIFRPRVSENGQIVTDRCVQGPFKSGRWILTPDAMMVALTYVDSRVTPPRGVALVPLEGEPKVSLRDIPADCLRWTADSRSLLYSSFQGGDRCKEANRFR